MSSNGKQDLADAILAQQTKGPKGKSPKVAKVGPVVDTTSWKDKPRRVQNLSAASVSVKVEDNKQPAKKSVQSNGVQSAAPANQPAPVRQPAVAQAQQPRPRPQPVVQVNQAAAPAPVATPAPVQAQPAAPAAQAQQPRPQPAARRGGSWFWPFLLGMMAFACLFATVLGWMLVSGRGILPPPPVTATPTARNDSPYAPPEAPMAPTGECQKVFNYAASPQPMVGHPSFYQETGVNSQQMCWEVALKEGFVLIIGGFAVDGQSGGIYRAIAGPGTVTTRVTDGFIAIVTREWGEREFCFRLSQAVQYGWARGSVSSLSGWTCSTAQPATAPKVTPAPAVQASVKERRPTGEGKTLQFNVGESVFGWEIVLSNGKKCSGGGCYLTLAPVGGTVLSGVVNPWKEELPVGIKVWIP